MILNQVNQRFANANINTDLDNVNLEIVTFRGDYFGIKKATILQSSLSDRGWLIFVPEVGRSAW